jgi:hypothetical protein
MTSMNYFHPDISKSTNTVVHFDMKSGDLCPGLRTKTDTIYMMQIGCSIFHPAIIEQRVAH